MDQIASFISSAAIFKLQADNNSKTVQKIDIISFLENLPEKFRSMAESSDCPLKRDFFQTESHRKAVARLSSHKLSPAFLITPEEKRLLQPDGVSTRS